MYSLTVLEARSLISIMGQNQGIDSSMHPLEDPRIHSLSLKAPSSNWAFLSLLSVLVQSASISTLSIFMETVCVCACIFFCSVLSDSLRPYEVQPTRLLCPWNSPDKSTRQGSHFLLQRIFLTQGLNRGLLHCREILHHLSHQESPLHGAYSVSHVSHKDSCNLHLEPTLINQDNLHISRSLTSLHL